MYSKDAANYTFDCIYERQVNMRAAIGSSNSMESYELLFPVPRYQINLNPAKIEQNDGY